MVQAALATISAVIQARLARIKPELDAWSGIVVHCPACLQLSWIFTPFDPASRCRFCGREWSEQDGCDAAEDYVHAVLGESRHEAAQGRTGWSVSDCPECELEALIAVATRDDPNSHLTQACFRCGFVTTDRLGSCGRCGRTTTDPDQGICSHCLHDLAGRE